MFEPDKWAAFAAAIVGATAAIMGLLVATVAVRLDIVSTRRAAATRGAHALLLLTLPFVAGVPVLIPDQPSRLLGLELVLTAGAFGVALLLLDRRALAQASQTDHLARTLQLVAPNLTTTVGLAFAGASLAVEWGGGLYWLVPTVILAVVGGVASAWLFLLEDTPIPDDAHRPSEPPSK
jgi:hypothetical protein